MTYQKTQKREKKKGVEWMSFHHSINFMPNMSTKSHEELRLEDYKINNKGGPGSANATNNLGAPTLGSSSFGTNSSIGLGSGNNTSFGNTNTGNTSFGGNTNTSFGNTNFGTNNNTQVSVQTTTRVSETTTIPPHSVVWGQV